MCLLVRDLRTLSTGKKAAVLRFCQATTRSRPGVQTGLPGRLCAHKGFLSVCGSFGDRSSGFYSRTHRLVTDPRATQLHQQHPEAHPLSSTAFKLEKTFHRIPTLLYLKRSESVMPQLLSFYACWRERCCPCSLRVCACLYVQVCVCERNI